MRPHFCTLRMALVALLMLVCSNPLSAQDELIARMQDGGAVVFLRNAETDYSQIDTGRLNDRAGQRNLSEAGRIQARELGAAFDARHRVRAHIRQSRLSRP